MVVVGAEGDMYTIEAYTMTMINHSNF